MYNSKPNRQKNIKQKRTQINQINQINRVNRINQVNRINRVNRVNKINNAILFKKEFGLIIIAAIIITASFLWKDLLTDIENIYFSKKRDMFGRIIYTISITAILIVIIIIIQNVFSLPMVSHHNNHIKSEPSNYPEEQNDPIILPEEQNVMGSSVDG